MFQYKKSNVLIMETRYMHAILFNVTYIDLC